MNGVSVWDARPSADDLLGARLARGWTPTATSTVDGEIVLGHAACVLRSSPVRSSGE
ncbi:MAG TPA: hypothetical protein VLQ79_05920 [Myxococcaceae bacterium]|nr:hypothetical protein [Myxococcaceae bacterium]